MSDLRKLLDAYKPRVKVKAVDMTDEWGCVVYVRKLPLAELLEFKSDEEIPITKTVAACLCDAEGNLAYKQDEHEQLNKFLLDDLAKIYREATSHNTINVDDAKKN